MDIPCRRSCSNRIMFHMGRYDPKNDRQVVEKDHAPAKRIPTKKQGSGARDGSSSSAPSTDTDDSRSIEHDTSIGKNLHVIAPEQKTMPSVKAHVGGTDEEYDDFDSVQNEEPEITESNHNTKEIATALHMSSLPIKDAAHTWDLAPFLVENLQRDGYDHFFPIQSLVIPNVISSERHPHIRARDVCVAAPTGSGKTLAFVIPVLNALSSRRVRRLRALVVLPSRDLATQVFKVFDRYTHGSDLHVGLAVGQRDFSTEQEALTVGPREVSRFDDVARARHRYSFHPGSAEHALEAFSGVPGDEKSFVLPRGGRSAVDVLVATPGRLVDHLDKTPGFTLQHLRFLVIDEADRLVNQSYHNWIDSVVNGTNSASVREWHKVERVSPVLDIAPDKDSFSIDPITWRRGGTEGDNSLFSTNDSYSSVVASVCRPVQLRKLLYSATLTRDPQKLASLGLVNPKHFDAHFMNRDYNSTNRQPRQRYSMPPGLSEHTVECTAEQKPLVLLAIVLEYLAKGRNHEDRSGGIIVVFTSSVDSTHRLVRLLQLLWAAAALGAPNSVAEFSSALNQKQRSSLMKRCNASDGGVSVVVCSDGMSRGMDLPSVGVVINYDVPSFAKTYVHRCGRTARAGKEGTAISVLKGGQVTQFQRMRGFIDFPNRVTSLKVKKELIRDVMPLYGPCVKTLRKVIETEKSGGLDSASSIPTQWIPSGIRHA